MTGAMTGDGKDSLMSIDPGTAVLMSRVLNVFVRSHHATT
jgi:hypothetical protein